MYIQKKIIVIDNVTNASTIFVTDIKGSKPVDINRYSVLI